MRTKSLMVILMMSVLMIAPLLLASVDRASWGITAKYGKDMSAQWQEKSDEEGGTIWCFAPGRTEVTVFGTNPDRPSASPWPCWRDEEVSPAADLMVRVSIKVHPAEGKALSVSGKIRRWQRIGSEPGSNYRLESEDFARAVRIGETWELPIGQGPGNKPCVLDISIRAANSQPDEEEPKNHSGLSTTVDCRYEMLNVESGGEPVYALSRSLELNADENESTPISGKIPLSVDGSASSYLLFEIKLSDVALRGGTGADRPEAEAVFEMNRILAVDDASTNDSTTIQAKRTIMSTIRRPIRLSATSTLRIELPRQEGEELPEGTHEVVVLELVESAGTK